MTKAYGCRLSFLVPVACLLLTCLAYTQDVPSRGYPTIHPNLEARISGLPFLQAQSTDAPDVLAAALATVLKDRDLCCDRQSALEGRLPQSDPVSLKEVAAKLQGRQLRTDGRPVLITAELLAPAAVTAARLVSAMRANHAPLMEWNSHLYVVAGLIYDDALYTDGMTTYVVHKLLLVDPRYSDARREVVFDRDTEDMSRVSLLFLTVAAQ